MKIMINLFQLWGKFVVCLVGSFTPDRQVERCGIVDSTGLRYIMEHADRLVPPANRRYFPRSVLAIVLNRPAGIDVAMPNYWRSLRRGDVRKRGVLFGV